MLGCHSLDILLGSETEGTTIISKEVASKVKLHWTGSFELEFVRYFKLMDDSSGILGCDHEVVNVHSDVFVVVSHILHPDIWLAA